MHVEAGTESDVPAVIPSDYPRYKFLRWWTERGQGYYLLNNQMVQWMRQGGPEDDLLYRSTRGAGTVRRHGPR